MNIEFIKIILVLIIISHSSSAYSDIDCYEECVKNKCGYKMEAICKSRLIGQKHRRLLSEVNELFKEQIALNNENKEFLVKKLKAVNKVITSKEEAWNAKCEILEIDLMMTPGPSGTGAGVMINTCMEGFYKESVPFLEEIIKECKKTTFGKPCFGE